MWIIAFLLLFVLVFLLLDAYAIIPKAHYGVRLILGRRISKMSGVGRFFFGKGVCDEGLRLKIPFLEKIELFPYELATIPIDVKVFSSDKLEITVQGSVQFRPDKELLEKIYAEMSENAIKVGLVDAVEYELGNIAGSKEGDVFIQSREELGNLINCVLRLKVPPHYEPHKYSTQEDLYCENGEIQPEKRIEFYKINKKKIREMLDGEAQEVTLRSPIEERYGFDIVTFALARVDFSAATKKALEEKRQAEARADIMPEKIKMMQLLGDKGLTPEQANNASDVMLGKAAPRQVHSFEFEGLEGLKGLIQINQSK
ncbi:MAG: hypothetical protein HYT28_03060 [Parcubacteria group bacterium]|nr:hypothetical protein [Parcubacteria group bacterium]